MKSFYSLACLIIFFSVMLTIYSCNSPDKTTSDKAQDSIAAMISRGDYLVNKMCHCMGCHGEGDNTKFSFPIIPGTEGKGGEEIEPGIFVRNITPYALKDWTDEELFKVLTTGIRKNGDTLTMIMPYTMLATMPKDEVYAIMAYLRTLKPIAYDVPERKIDDQRAFWSMAYKEYYLKQSAKKLTRPEPGDKVKMGQYLVSIGGCKGCHTKFNMEKLDYEHDVYLAGGVNFADTLRGFQVNSANLTPDTLTGIGAWSEEVFLAKFRSFRDSTTYSYDAGKYNTFMPWTYLAKLKDEDLSAIYAYLRTVPPVTNKVEKWPQGE